MVHAFAIRVGNRQYPGFTCRPGWFIFFTMVFTRRNVDWWCERGILLLVLATLVFAPLALGAVDTWAFLIVQTLAVAIGLVWLLRIWAGHEPKLLWPPLSWAVLAFVLYAVARYFIADIEYVARLELIRVGLYAFVFLAVISNLYDQDAAETITYTLTVVAVAASMYAVFQFCHHSYQVWGISNPYIGRGSGTYINPDHFAGFLELVLPLTAAFLLAGRIGVLTRVLLGYAVLAILAGLTVTFSRGGWIAAGAGLLLLLGFLLLHRNHRLRALLALLVLLGGGGYFATHVLSNTVTYMRRVAKPDDAGPKVLDTQSRLDMWSATIRIWQDYPLWGVGPGHFDYRFREYRPERFQLRPEHAHNDYLELLADWGVAGGLIVLGGVGIFIFGLGSTWPHIRREESDFGTAMSSRYAFYLGAVCGLFALAVHSLVDFNLHIPANALAGVVVLAVLAGNLRFATKRYWVRIRRPQQWILTLILGGGVIYLGTQIWQRTGELRWIAQARALPSFSEEQTAAWQQALAWEPKNYNNAYNLGECYRIQSQDGGDNYRELAQKALAVYALGIRLNPHDAYCRLRSGMCLDLLGRHAEAEPYYLEAETRDPNGNYVVGYIGWHYLQIADYPAARQWFLRAYKLSSGAGGNEMVQSCLTEICEPKLEERAAGKLPMEMYYHGIGKDN